MFNYDDVSFRYEPSPIGVAKRLFTPDLYAELSDTFPSPELLRPDPGLGKRSSLSRSRSTTEFTRFMKSAPAWRELWRWSQSRDFLVRTLTMLASHGVDVGGVEPRDRLLQRLWRLARAIRHLDLRSTVSPFRVELLFVVMPADGGFLLPHTDVASKVVNLAVSMLRPGEWDPAFGGSTDIEWPNDPRRIFSRGIDRLTFEDVHVLDSIAYVPNQAVIVVKTFNSWHSVRPMQGRDSPALRKTLNINILHN